MRLKYSGLSKLKNIKKHIRINIIITHYCNFHCFYCIAENRMSNKTMLMMDEYDMFLQNIYTKFKDYEYVELMFNGGEPFDHPHIYEFIKKFLDMFPAAGIITVLTNGCSENISAVLRKFDENDIKRIQFTTSYHSSEISIEDYIAKISTYADINIHNHIRILLSECNQHNVFEQHEMLLDAIPKPQWIVSIKPILIGQSDLIVLPEEYMRNIIMYYTTKYILYGDINVSVEQMCFVKQYTYFNKCICYPHLFITMDGTYIDRHCQAQQYRCLYSDIFKKPIDIQSNVIICNQQQCCHSCDYFTAKYFV